MEKQSIVLVSQGLFEAEILERISDDVAQEFRLPVVLEEKHSDLAAYYDPARRQYDGNRLLEMLDSQYQNSGMKTMGLFRVDLFIPVLTFIFGQAVFGGHTGIASIYRLKNEQYGMPRDEEQLYDRFRKVVIHELGHTFGLTHCRTPSCVMRQATYVEDLDLKKYRFCDPCQETVVWASGSWK